MRARAGRTMLVGVEGHGHGRPLLLPPGAAHARGDAQQQGEGQDPDHHADDHGRHGRRIVLLASALAAAARTAPALGTTPALRGGVAAPGALRSLRRRDDI